MSGDSGRGFGDGLRVVVIDDESVIGQFLEMAFEDWGFTVEVFHNLKDGTERCTRRDYDLVLSDKNLPDGSGLDLCTALLAGGGDFKVMLMSGYANLASAVEAIKHGVAEYFVKPLDLDDLRVRLSRVVEMQRLERGNRALVVELKNKNATLEGMAVRDPLTQLYNHAYMQDALRREISRSQRHHRQFSFALIDVDRFNDVNDTFGHAAGDAILREIARLLAAPGRAADLQFHVTDQELAARFGADVFALILPETPKAGAAIWLERFRNVLRGTKFAIDGLPAQTLSASLVSYPDDANDRESLLRAAQTALGAAKIAGGDMVVNYSAELENAQSTLVAEQARKTQALVRSLAARSFRFLYQPIVRCQDQAIFAYEGLCRPIDPGFAHVGELFETTVRLGRIRDLGRVLRPLTVVPLTQLPKDKLLFINLHPQDLGDEVLLAPEPEVAPWASRIVFEITETEAITDYGRARERIAILRSHGFRIALDDLGSGYSSLNALTQFQPDFVKLDMQLVRGIQQDSRAARLIRHLLDFCKDEGMPVIAEGVETIDEFNVIRELGVPLVQGYLFARPAPPFCEITKVP